MTKIVWDKVGERYFENGVDHGVLYLPNQTGVYDTGVAWNGLVSVSESPSGAEATKQYADNIVYLNLVSAEEFGATIEAFTYPDEFSECDGSRAPVDGLLIGQQTRRTFGLSYRTKVGNDLNPDLGHKIHLVYGALAAPTEKAYTTINDSPEALTFSWEVTTTPVEVPGFKPTATLTIDSTKVDSVAFGDLEDILYGTQSQDPRLPLPEEIIALFSGDPLIEVFPTMPTFDSGTNTITIPSVTGVTYTIGGETVTGDVVIEEDTIVKAYPNAGYKFPNVADDDWYYEYTE